MDRTIVQNGEGLRSADFLLAQRSAMIGLAKQAAASLGSGPLLDGLAVTPAGGLTVSVAPGAIYALANVDATPYGTLTADTTHSVLKQGLLMDAVTLSCPAPGTGGQSINYLVEVQFQENDGANTGLPFYNSATPTVPSFTNGNTLRQDVCAVQVKAGTAAATGSQTTPAPDAGWTAAYVVTVANAQATIITANISVAPGAPFLTFKTRDLAVMFAVWPDTGGANALVITPQPALTALTAGMELTVSPANANSGAATINVNGLGAVSVINPDGSALLSGEIVVGRLMTLLYTGGVFQWLNAPTATTQPANDSSTKIATTAYADLSSAAAAAGASSGGLFVWQQQGT